MIIFKTDYFGQKFLYVLEPDRCALAGPGYYTVEASPNSYARDVHTMQHIALQNLIGRAIIDKKFRGQLLNGSREQVIDEFDLTDAEKEVLRSIEAQNFDQFASQIHHWIETTSRPPAQPRVRLVRVF